MTPFWLWVGLISMTAGAGFFGFCAYRASGERWRILLVLNFFITAIAAVLYLAMVMGQGYGVFYGHSAYWVRYVTWVLSTPLLILVISHLGKNRLSTIGALIGADVMMIGTGFVATISPPPISYVWYLVSCGFFVGILYLLFSPYRQEAESTYPSKIGKQSFSRLIVVHAALWTAYPIVWILADSGIGLLSDGVEAMFYTLLDITAKVGFGLLSVNTLQKLEDTASTPQSSANERVVVPARTGR